ncbi:MAG: hypothetical protein ACXVJW_14395 [Acidimicrobiia bacterium]
MPTLRIEREEQETMAVDDLVDLASRVPGLDVTPTGPRTVSFHLTDGSWPATVVPVDSAGLADAERLTSTTAAGWKVVVGNKLSEDARTHLTRQGWSWFDRRFGAHIASKGQALDIVFVAGAQSVGDDEGANTGPVLLASPRSDGAIRGRAGISYAAALLLDPEQPPSMRSVAREVGMSPGAISNAAKLLDAAGLVVDGRPAVPDLFWALAEVWRPVKAAGVAAVPDPSSRQFAYHLDQLDKVGWAAGSDLAALELGTPLFTTDERPWLWVPTQTEARRAQRTLGTASWNERQATIAVPPTPLVVSRRVPPTPRLAPWPLIHPVFAALELARDPGRGREILERWEPDGVARVWS